MGCVNLIKGFDIGCEALFRKYYQNVILINKGDVKQVAVSTTNDQHRIQFNLLQDKTGYLFKGNENVGLLNAKFSKKEEKGVPYYNHNVDVVVAGTSENIKTLLKQIDNSNYFAVIQFKSGDVEVYGFDNGLGSGSYEYSAQSPLGGSVIGLSSKYDEYEPPYLYYSNTINEDFNNLFTGLEDFLGGDFNSDFNNDFYNNIV
jgi:hypothetical protein